MERVGELTLEWAKWLLHVAVLWVNWRVGEMTGNP